MVEQEIAKRYPQQQMRCPVHLSIGQEAAAVGVCSALKRTDWVFSGHRNHAHYLAKGGSLNAMIAEIYGKANGCCGGKGGSMHLTDQAVGFIAATPIVGSTVPIAVGAALTAQREVKGRVVVVFLGDGAMETGVVHESLNFACLKRLPILFVCENNFYSVYSSLDVRQPKQRTLSQLAEGHGLQAVRADGNDVNGVYESAVNAIDCLRRGDGPRFMELSTYRWLEHCGPNYDNDLGYRKESEFRKWIDNDPLSTCTRSANVKLSTSDVSAIREEIDEAFSAAIAADFPDTKSAAEHVYAAINTERIECLQEYSRITYAEAVREAQDLCLSEHDKSYIMGLGVPDPKGIFGTTTGLQELYGVDRVFDTPLSENAMTGVAIGSAITGLRPILTHQRLDFALVSMDQIVNQAAKWHYMFNGKMTAPLLIRMIIGRGWGQGPQHSQNLKAWFAHIPGLRVLAPSTPKDAKGMIISGLKDNSPTIIIEHRWLHGTYGMVPKGSYDVDLERAKTAVQGSDITLIASSYMTIECIRAAKIMGRFTPIKAEVIDLRSLRPVDYASIISSVEKTRVCMIVDDSDPSCGIASDIAAVISNRMFGKLIAPPEILSVPGHPCPTSHYISSNYYPTLKDIILRVHDLLDINISPSLYAALSKLKNGDQPSNDFKGPF